MFLLPMFLLGHFTSAFAIDSGKLLENAYAMRSADPMQAEIWLNEINVPTLNSAQQDRYKYLKAYMLFMKGQVSNAITEFEVLADSGTTPSEAFAAKASLVTLYAGTQDWTNGFKALEYVEANLPVITDKTSKEHAHMAVINFYNAIDESEHIIDYIEPLIDQPFSQRFICLIKMQRFDALLNYDFARLNQTEFQTAIDSCDSLNEPIVTVGIYQYFGDYYLQSGLVDEAIALLLPRLDDAIKASYKPLSDGFNAVLSQAYFEKKELVPALEYAERVLTDLNAGLLSDATITAHEIRYKIAKESGNYQQALTYYQQYADAKSLNLTKEKARLLAVQQAKQETISKQNKIVLLDRENSLLRAQAEIDQQSDSNRQLTIVLLLMTLLMAGVWVYKNRSNYLQLQEVSRKDSLTGLANRHFFHLQAEQLSKSHKHSEEPLSFVVFDLDDFKKINDDNGHQVGDSALKIVAEAAKSACRKNEIIGRLGGEEFGILLPGCTQEKAIVIAEACRKAIENTNSESSHNFTLSASFGVASSEKHGYKFEKLFAAADQALYCAKREGKNRVK